MDSLELRQKFRKFFNENNHIEIASSSLIPDKSDPTVLLTTAGMQPLVPYLMGAKHSRGNRLFDTQKCFRTPDIEEVGDDTHHTFFEMLGNWSLGDYFKEEAIDLAYRFFVDELGLDPSRFAITIFKGDKDAPRDYEAEQIWLSKGLKKEQIFEFDKKDNFWGPAGTIGPCGPCSEIHYDRGEKYGEDVGPNSDENQRYVEIWNLVFMEYNKKEDGSYEKLSQKNVDTGVGFERLLSILTEKDSSFDTDLFAEILTKIEEIAGKKYNENKTGFRVIADHIRGATFLIADGVVPGNTGRDYVLRRIIRRAVMHGEKMGISGQFVNNVAKTVIEKYQDEYLELKERKEHIFTVLSEEEASFTKTLERGKKILSDYIKKGHVSGKKAFELFDTYGFPFELTQEIAEEKGIKIDENEFKAELEAQRERSRSAGAMFERKEDMTVFEGVKSTFFLRDVNEHFAEILKISKAKSVDNIYFIALNETPFYAESGGQVADIGTIDQYDVADVQKTPHGVFIHTIQTDNLSLNEGDKVKVKIDLEKRNQIRRHHSLAHLLQAALRSVLGEHVEQQGSEVVCNRCRFDFSHNKNLSQNEINQIENLIQKWVTDSYEVVTEILPIEEAQSRGAMALFSDKFEKGQEVRMIQMGDVSLELCGGTHIDNTAQIGAVKIISESSISSGIRRIEMLCAGEAQKMLQAQYRERKEIESKLKTPDLMNKISSLIQERKELEKLLKEKEQKLLAYEAEDESKLAQNINGKKVIIKSEKASMLALKAKSLAKYIDIAVLFDPENGAIAIASRDKSAKETLSAIGKELQGGGGGSDAFAQGKVQNPSIEKIVEIIKSL
ncbi:MAG: alanine--tRNA ligase [Candidatus Gracilibacteria bacterium]|jgi:alanyl-tRNA synthetase|nr:alanine--tRNA ligase [Candidatus Gracilibacteria bacterium]